MVLSSHLHSSAFVYQCDQKVDLEEPSPRICNQSDIRERKQPMHMAVWHAALPLPGVWRGCKSLGTSVLIGAAQSADALWGGDGAWSHPCAAGMCLGVKLELL